MNLRKVLRENETALRSFHGHPLAAALPAALALRCPTLSLLDTTFSSRDGGPEPMFPFPSLDAYYDWARTRSSHATFFPLCCGSPVGYMNLSGEESNSARGIVQPMQAAGSNSQMR
jgi:hypothetical protein